MYESILCWGYVVLGIQKGGNLEIRVSFSRLFLFCSSDFSTMSMATFLMCGGEYVLGEKKKGSHADSIPHNFIFK